METGTHTHYTYVWKRERTQEIPWGSTRGGGDDDGGDGDGDDEALLATVAVPPPHCGNGNFQLPPYRARERKTGTQERERQREHTNKQASFSPHDGSEFSLAFLAGNWNPLCHPKSSVDRLRERERENIEDGHTKDTE